MVRSKLHPHVNYHEYKTLEIEDINNETTMYQTDLLGTEILIAIGRGKTDKPDLIYYPIYLINSDEQVVKQIGVFEILASKLNEILDENEEVDLDKMTVPLIYSFVTAEMLEKDMKGKKTKQKEVAENASDEIVVANEIKEQEQNQAQKQNQEQEQNQEQNQKQEQTQKQTQDQNQEQEEINKKKSNEELRSKMKEFSVPAQTKDLSKMERSKYIKKKDEPWIQTHMKNPNFDLVDNEGAGDCFFAVIRDAYSSIGKAIEVQELRDMLAASATPSVFQTYKDNYNMYADLITSNKIEMKKLAVANSALKTRFEHASKKEQASIIHESKKNAEKFQELKSEISLNANLMEHFHFMKDINSLDDFQKFVKSSRYWADSWAISQLEVLLKTKFIILSSERFLAKDFANVLQCGDFVHESHGKKFEPTYYIMFDHTGGHYILVTYKDQSLFTFKEIPYDIKLLVVEKCMEQNAGIYSLIPQFVKFREEEFGIKELDSDSSESQVDIQVSTANPLYDDNIVFQFYDKSMDKPLPGMGSGEKIDSKIISKFSELAKNSPQWRKMLSNLWEPVGNETQALFTMDGHKWRTLEHYIQGCRFKKENHDHYLKYSLDSESDLSKSLASNVKSPSPRVDSDFYAREEKELEDAQYAKFSQNSYLKTMLLNTKNAKLVQYIRSKPPRVSNELMRIRQRLMND